MVRGAGGGGDRPAESRGGGRIGLDLAGGRVVNVVKVGAHG